MKEIVLQSLEDINDNFNTSLTLQSNLVGEIDSIILVHLLIIIESRLNELGYNITIADDKAFSQVNSPFLSVKSLIEYLERIINEDNINYRNS